MNTPDTSPEAIKRLKDTTAWGCVEIVQAIATLEALLHEREVAEDAVRLNAEELMRASAERDELRARLEAAEASASDAASVCADKIGQYLQECSKSERWPDCEKIDVLFRDNFAPVLRHDVAKLQTELTAAQELVDQLKAQLGEGPLIADLQARVRELEIACESGWGEPQLIKHLRAREKRLRELEEEAEKDAANIKRLHALNATFVGIEAREARLREALVRLSNMNDDATMREAARDVLADTKRE